jgi:hypothetical protein
MAREKGVGAPGQATDVIAPPPGELFSETNDNSVAILLTYETALVLLAGDTEVREEYMASGPTRGLKRSSTFRNYTQSATGFRALLAEGASEVELALVQRLRSRALLTNYRQMTEADLYEKSTTKLVGVHRQHYYPDSSSAPC